jgi:hypothetical protein
MIVLRKSQMDILKSVPQKQFKNDMVEHLKLFDPILCGTAGPNAVETFVDIAYEQALTLGLSQKFAVTAYIEIAITLGCEFHQDPQYYWLHPFIKSLSEESSDEKIRLLQFHVVRFLDEVHGAHGERALTALNKIERLTGNELGEIASSYSSKAPGWLEFLHPGKCAFIGSDAVSSLASYAQGEATRHNFEYPESVPVLLGLMFSFGSGILRDPLYSWVPETLSKPTIGEKRLFSRTQAYFHSIREHLQKVNSDVRLQPTG